MAHLCPNKPKQKPKRIVFTAPRLMHLLQNLSCIAVFIVLSFNTAVCSSQTNAKNSDPVVKGQVLNIEDGTPVPRALVTNQRTQYTVSADLNGNFSINARLTDSLAVSSLGFQAELVTIPSIYVVSEFLTIYARPLSYLLPDINVSVKKEQIKIDKENRIVSPYFRRDMNIMREKPISEKIYDNQISFVKLPFGSSKKGEEKMKEATSRESEWALVSRYYNKETVMRLTGLNNTEADNLMIYINSKKLEKRLTSKENAAYTILEQFKNYKAEHP